MCTCRPCYLLFTDQTAHLNYRAVPDRYLAFGEFVACDARMGRAADPGRARVPVPQLGAGTHDRLLSGPGRRHGVGTAARRVGDDRRRPSRTRCVRPDVEALLVRRIDGAAQPCYLVPIDACYELVGTAAHAVARVRRRAGGARGDRGVLRRGPTARSRPAPAAAVMSDYCVLRARRLRRAVRGRAATDRPAADRGGDRADRCMPSPALPGPHRAAAPAVRRGRAARHCAGCSATAAVGRHAQAVPVDAVQHHRPGLHRRDRSRPVAALHLRLRRRRIALPARPGRRHGADHLPVLRHRLHEGRERVRRAAGALGLRGALRPAGGGVAADDRRPTSRTPAGSGSTRRCSRGSPTTAPSTG